MLTRSPALMTHSRFALGLNPALAVVQLQEQLAGEPLRDGRDAGGELSGFSRLRQGGFGVCGIRERPKSSGGVAGGAEARGASICAGAAGVAELCVLAAFFRGGFCES